MAWATSCWDHQTRRVSEPQHPVYMVLLCHHLVVGCSLHLGAGPFFPHADVQAMSLLVVIQGMLSKTNRAVGQEKRASMGQLTIARAPLSAGVMKGETKWSTIRGSFGRGCARCTVGHEGWGRGLTAFRTIPPMTFAICLVSPTFA